VDGFPVEVTCRVLEVAPSTYYEAISREPSARGLEDQDLMGLASTASATSARSDAVLTRPHTTTTPNPAHQHQHPSPKIRCCNDR
jgi:hypothetical protein